jgi:hypothetical protein
MIVDLDSIESIEETERLVEGTETEPATMLIAKSGTCHVILLKPIDVAKKMDEAKKQEFKRIRQAYGLDF